MTRDDLGCGCLIAALLLGGALLLVFLVVGGFVTAETLAGWLAERSRP